MKLLRIVLLGFCLSQLLACAVKTLPVNKYQLDSVSSQKFRAKHQISSILIAKPKASSGFDDEKMRYMKTPYLLEAFAKNEWVAPPADMLQSVLIQSVQNTQHFRAVVRPPFPGSTSYRLDTQLIELKHDFIRNPSAIVLVLKADVIRENGDKVIASHRFHLREQAFEASPYGGVLAANKAVKKLMNQLMRFLVKATG